MNNDEAYKHIENIVFKYEEKELSSLEDRKLNNEALNHIREVLKNERPQDDADDYIKSLECVAWQSLPEPYKKGGKEK